MSAATMRAARLEGRRDVRMVEVPRPTSGPGEVLLRIDAALTCGTDAKVFRRGYHARMIQPPALFGHEYTGTIEAVGEGVEGFEVGDAVVGANSAPCGVCEFCRRGRPALCDDLLFLNGAFAEWLLVPERIVSKNLWPRPVGLDARLAAAAEPLACVLKGVDVLAPRAGDRAVLLGAGPIALMFVAELAARDVQTVVFVRNAEAAEMAHAMGAAAVVRGPSVGESHAELMAVSPGRRGFPLVIEAAGSPETSQASVDLAAKGARVLLFGGCAKDQEIRLDPARLHYEEIALVSSFHHTPEFFQAALDALATGRVDVAPLLDRPVGLTGVADALERMCDRRTRRKVPVLPALDAREGSHGHA